MTLIDWLYIALSAALLGMVFVAGARTPTIGKLFHMAAAAAPLPAGLLAAMQKARLHQYRYSFWVVMGASGAATLVLALALLKGVLFTPAETTATSAIIGVIGGLGGGAGLFSFARKVWRNSFEEMKPYFPLPQPAATPLQRVLFTQFAISFWAMMAALIVALLMLTVAILLAIFRPAGDALYTVINLISGLGESALFAFNYQVRKDCGDSLTYFYPPPPPPPP